MTIKTKRKSPNEFLNTQKVLELLSDTVKKAVKSLDLARNQD